MKSILFILGLSFIASAITAQRFSAGVRNGASYWPATQYTVEVVKGTNGFSWEKSIYGRYESNKRFAADLAITHNKLNYQYPPQDVIVFDAPSYRELNYRRIVNTFDCQASAQWRVTKASSLIKSYFGASITYGRQSDHHSFTAQEIPSNELYDREWTANYGLAFVGLNNYTSYAINKHINVHSAISFDINPDHGLSSLRPAKQFPESKVSWTIGCGYTF
ncbi:hypothetical protein [Polluticoccus soli]|uniref:hypothetical protein n=1 Tax=Polluticoccus soli TaxID=3034150 RepID=UPI0023E17ADE|nr:hypothetical protein [Flavipsychrobacter sp. JY13-12]